ncbi:pyrroline-5-carboxylate reductase family protein [Pseudooceanicola sp. LIPI14-2-Ac024]|uniref:pyrroline-5-carboxylate reductase family protein n=1 Tax=Pseudooceanicola sp. LIPI14-2-Ac024 TaxID=3344875 RepID=UPI0035CED058
MAKLGIIGGNGMLGTAIARGLLDSGMAGGDLWISSRSGRAGPLDDVPGLNVTRDSAELVAACPVVLLSVPPAQADHIGVDAADRLVISVMAGVTLDRIGRITGARRMVRAMSSPAAARRLAYSPFYCGVGVTGADRAAARALFAAVGLTDEVPDEAQIDDFTAMTGPVPGFVALFADAMVQFATDRGIAPEVADRAIRQLFLASGQLLSEEEATPGAQVQAMLDYDGTTAAGLRAMIDSPLTRTIAEGLDAAARKAREIG